jgi:hypothetical protein
MSWTIEDPELPAIQIATNLHYTAAVQAQTQIVWGHFLNGLCALEIQEIINTQHNSPLNVRTSMMDKQNDTMCVGLRIGALETEEQ